MADLPVDSTAVIDVGQPHSLASASLATNMIESDTPLAGTCINTLPTGDSVLGLCFPTPIEPEHTFNGMKSISTDPYLFEPSSARSDYMMTSAIEMGNSPASTLLVGTDEDVFDANGTTLNLAFQPHTFEPSLWANWAGRHQHEMKGPLSAIDNDSSYNKFEPNSVVSHLVDGEGRRRSQSMPPDMPITFRRKMDDGRMVNITKNRQARQATPPPSTAHHRSQTMKRTSERMQVPMTCPHSPRSDHGFTPNLNSLSAPFELYHLNDMPMEDDSIKPARQEKRRRINPPKKNAPFRHSSGPPPPPTALRQELEAMVTPLMIQLDAFRYSIMQQLHDLRTCIHEPLEVERSRQRAQNKQVTHLNQNFVLLAGPMQPHQWVELPQNGYGVRKMNNVDITTLLNRYGVPFVSNMFLHEKKALYLQFLGCNRAFIHRVLDVPE